MLLWFVRSLSSTEFQLFYTGKLPQQPAHDRGVLRSCVPLASASQFLCTNGQRLEYSDHCAKKLLPWFDGMLEANEKYFEQNGVPLFSSHMLDLSEEPIEENLEICKEYLERFAKIDLLLEMELGITGGEEDGVDNTDVDKSELYSKPEEIYEVRKGCANTLHDSVIFVVLSILWLFH